MTRRIFSLALTFGCLILPAQKTPVKSSSEWAGQVGNEYRVISNVVYKVANNYEAKLDVYLPRESPKPYPTVIYIHGGGWVGGSKETAILRLMPYLEKGMAVVNVGYRLGRVSLAPAAVEDCRCALRWVVEHADEHGFDPSKLVVTGHSAGGHLSLMTGILEPSAGLDNDCPGDKPLSVAAVVNYFGITDVADLLEGANRQQYAVRWLGSLPNREGVARQASPLTYVRSGLPPFSPSTAMLIRSSPMSTRCGCTGRWTRKAFPISCSLCPEAGTEVLVHSRPCRSKRPSTLF